MKYHHFLIVFVSFLISAFRDHHFYASENQSSFLLHFNLTLRNNSLLLQGRHSIAPLRPEEPSILSDN